MAEAVTDVPSPEEGVTSNVTTPEEGVTLDVTPPEEGVTSNVTPRAKKPRKPRPPKLVTKLAAVSEAAPTAQEAPLPLEFWAGLMQTQKVIMAQRKSDHYNSFRIV